jgi:PAS domain S-box-containing protein
MIVEITERNLVDERDSAAAATPPPAHATTGNRRPGSRYLRRNLVWLLFLACGFLIFVSASSIYLVVSSQSTRELMNHALQLENKLWGILAAVRVSESEQRGYLLTGDPRYLDIYQNTVAASLNAIADGKAATIGNPAQQRTLAEIESLVAQKFGELQETIRLHDAGDHAAALALVRTGVGRELMTNIRVPALQMMEDQRRLIAEHTSNSVSTNIWLLLVNLAGLALIIVLAVAAVLVMRRNAGKELTQSENRGDELQAAAVSRQAVSLKTEVLQNAILNSADFAIIATDAKGIIQLFNVGAERMLGYAASDVVNKITPSDLHDPVEVIARAEGLSAESGTVITPGFGALAFKASRGIQDKYETTKIRKDGSRFPAQVSVTALRNDQTEIIGYLFIGTDNSAAQAAIIAAKREKIAEEMFRQAVESCPSGMVMADSTGRIVLVNGEIERMFGYQRDELIGQSVDMIVPGHLYAEHLQHRDKLIAKSEIRHLAAGRTPVGRRKDGSEFPVEIGLNPIHTGDDLLVLSVIVDTSERKRIDRLKDEFVSTVSHELRTPLTSISGSLGLLVGQCSGQLPQMAERLLTIAHTNSQRLVRLINDILDIEKLESGHVVFNLSQIDVRLLVEQAVEDNRGFAEGYGVHIRFDTASVDCEVNADPDRLVQVITNLLSNAIKFSPAEQEVLVTVEKNDNIIRISVRDHGSGVPADFKGHIFTKFAQADGTSSRQKGGTGLGLSIVKQIVERLGGEVGFNDVAGGGTVFYVELPAWDGAAGREIDHEARPGAPRILFCEDDRDTATAVREGLRQAGFAVDFAYTMTVAIQRAAATRYAAILVDLQLPDGDGIGLILRLRAQPEYRHTPIVVTAGDPEHGRNDVRSFRLNVLDWLVKPIDFGHLARILKSGIALQPHARPRVLHVDDDRDVLAMVMHALREMADVVSVDSIEGARRALAADRIDLAVLDILLGSDSGLDLLPDLHDKLGRAIPVIVFSTHGAGFPCGEQVEAAFGKSNASLEGLVTTIRDRLALLPVRPALEVA